MSVEKVKYNQSKMNEVVLPPEDKQPDFSGMQDFGAIGVFDNFVKWEFCDSVIDSFNFWYNKKHIMKDDVEVKVTEFEGKEMTLNPLGDGGKQFDQGNLGRKDEGLFLEVADGGLSANTNLVVGSGFDMYAREYKGIIDSSDPLSSWTVKLQKTQAGGGYHQWHCEDGSFIYRDRVLTWMIYLNDIPYESGGATDFLHQKCSFQPTRGTAVYWPATYTHMHRGGFLTGDTPKYIATGWFLREPGNVTNRVIQEKLGQPVPDTYLNGEER